MNQSKLNILSACIVAFGLLSAGWFISQGLQTFRMGDRVVSVKGLAERDVEADLAIWTLSHTAIGNELAPVQEMIEKNESLLRAFLKRADFTPQEITVEPLQVQDLMAQAYRPEGIENGRYIITQLITVRTNDITKIDKALGAQGEVLRQGVVLTNSQLPVYIYTKLNDIKPQMLAEAVKNARQSADEFAADSGQKVGGLKSASQGMFQILSRDPNMFASEQNQRFKTVRVVSTLDFFLE